MNYFGTYTDEKGFRRDVSITESDSIEALKNDRDEILRKYNTDVVGIKEVKAEEGEALHLKVTVNAPSHYVTNSSDASPKPCDSMTVDIICRMGYPLEKVEARYPSNHRLASPNVFISGGACIDTWIPLKSSLITVVDKLVHDMIHDPNVTRYDSPACPSLIQWHKDGVREGHFPTIPPKNLYAPERVALPPRRNRSVERLTPLPRRNR